MPERDGYIPGVPCWVDTSQPDPEAVLDFYSGLFGWEFEDVMPPEDFTVAYVRFVNASSTTQPMTLYLTNRTTLAEVPIGGAVAYKTAGAFVAVPLGVSYDLATRTSGSSTNVFTRAQISFSPGRAYTITARGNTATASTMLLDNTANR